MFGIRDEISIGIWENDETREIRWKRSETKADEPNRNYSVILATLQITSYVHSRNSS